MSDKEFLLWLAKRLVEVYGENENVDFVTKTKSIAIMLPEGQRTPNLVGAYSDAKIFPAPSNTPYKPLTLSWCTSYRQEVEELGELIDGMPDDEKSLRASYTELTGKGYRRKKNG